MVPTWDPARYLQFADERSRPFFDLVDRIGVKSPGRVVDLGCGPGQLTATLTERWPRSEILGIDSSPEMIAAAGQHAGDRLSFELGDLRTWSARIPDVIISNATLQWLPDHRAQLHRLITELAPRGWLAFQVPANQDEPSHRLLYELAAAEPFAEFTAEVERPVAFAAETYLSDLAGPALRIDAWETTYLHQLSGPDPVFSWICGTSARPVLQVLPGELRSAFEVEFRRRLRQAYPPRSFGTVLPYHRVFVVAQRLD